MGFQFKLNPICAVLGGELFAKRRKKADKWVVEEGSLRSNPSQLADQFLVQQQDFQQQEYQVTIILCYCNQKYNSFYIFFIKTNCV